MPNSHPTPDTSPAGSGGGRFRTFWTTLPGILTGVAALLTAIVGLVGLWHSAGNGTTGPTTLPTSAYSAPASGPGRTTTGGKPTGVLTSGRLTMMRLDEADLEQGLVGNALPGADLVLDGGSQAHTLLSQGGFLAPTQGPASKSKCTAALNARHDALEDLYQLREESWLCLQTSEGHVAALRLTSLPGVGTPQLIFTYTVWQ